MSSRREGSKRARKFPKSSETCENLLKTIFISCGKPYAQAKKWEGERKEEEEEGGEKISSFLRPSPIFYPTRKIVEREEGRKERVPISELRRERERERENNEKEGNWHEKKRLFLPKSVSSFRSPFSLFHLFLNDQLHLSYRTDIPLFSFSTS